MLNSGIESVEEPWMVLGAIFAAVVIVALKAARGRIRSCPLVQAPQLDGSAGGECSSSERSHGNCHPDARNSPPAAVVDEALVRITVDTLRTEISTTLEDQPLNARKTNTPHLA